MNLHIKTTLIAVSLVASLSQQTMATPNYYAVDNLSKAQVAQLNALERQTRYRDMPTALDDRVLKHILTDEQLQQLEQNKTQYRENNTFCSRIAQGFSCVDY